VYNTQQNLNYKNQSTYKSFGLILFKLQN